WHGVATGQAAALAGSGLLLQHRSWLGTAAEGTTTSPRHGAVHVARRSRRPSDLPTLAPSGSGREPLEPAPVRRIVAGKATCSGTALPGCKRCTGSGQSPAARAKRPCAAGV